MPFLALGVEHRTSPLSVRESVALDGQDLDSALHVLARDPQVAEVAILSTCNRTEIYLFAETIEAAAASPRAYLLHRDVRLTPYLQTWKDMAAAEHLFRVAGGLESQILGESQILSQVKDALNTAQHSDTIGPNLHALFRAAISCARQARAGTALGRVNLSIGAEAVREAEAELGSLEGRAALVIGGGEIGRLAAEELRARSIGTLFIANRTESVAVDLASTVHATPIRLSDIPRIFPAVDVVVAATSAHHYILAPEDIPVKSLENRTTPVRIFDLAIPRDVDPTVGSIPGVILRDLDTLLPSGLDEHWEDDIRAVEAVIAAEVREFTAWYLTRRVAPVIANLRSHVEAVSEAEMKRIAPQLVDLTDRERAAVESMNHRLVDKMFHHLVLRLRLAAQTDPKLVEAAEFFFLHGEGGLFEHAAEEGSRTEANRSS